MASGAVIPSFSFGTEGAGELLLNINTSGIDIKNAKNGGVVTHESKIGLILDSSGSMGLFVAKSQEAVGKALTELGYAETKTVYQIDFSDNSTKTEISVKTLKTGPMRSKGGTMMGGVFPLVEELLNTYPNDPFILLMISDGDVSDRTQLDSKATRISEMIAKRSVPTRVLLLRLKTSGSSSPDTKALSLIGQLNSDGVAPVHDIKCVTDSRELDTTMAVIMTTITESLNKEGFNYNFFIPLKSTDGSKIFRRGPADEWKDQILLPSGPDNFILMKKPISSGVGSGSGSGVILGDQIAQFSDMSLNSEEQIISFLKFLEGQLRMWLVAGSNQNKDKIDATFKWLQMVAGHLAKIELSLGEGGSGGSSEILNSLRSRAAGLKRTIYKRERSVLNRILELQNQSNVAKFNSQQQADFLREVSDTKSGKRLVRRAGGKDADFDYDTPCRAEFKKLYDVNTSRAGAGNGGAGNGGSAGVNNSILSFYSHSSNADMLEDCKELYTSLAPVIGDTTADDILGLVGGVGLAFKGRIADFPDPWTYRVDTVYFGCYLSQADLWTAHTQSGGTYLSPPGLVDKPSITGVDVMRSPDIGTYNLLDKHCPEILKLQTSLTMRRMKAIIPGDILSLKSAMGVRIIVQMGQNSNGLPTELEVQTLIWVLDDLVWMSNRYAKNTFTDLANWLQKAEVGAYLTGDLEIPGALKPLACILGHAGTKLGDPRKVVADKEQIGRIFRAMYNLEILHRIRGKAKSGFGKNNAGAGAGAGSGAGAGNNEENWLAKLKTMLHTMLGINLSTNVASSDMLSVDTLTVSTDYNRSVAETQSGQYLPDELYSPENFFRMFAVRLLLDKLDAYTKGIRELNLLEFKNELNLIQNVVKEFSSSVDGDSNLRNFFGISAEMKRYQLGVIVQIMLAPELSDRVDTKSEPRKMRFPELLTEDAIEGFIRQTIENEYQNDYKRKRDEYLLKIRENGALELAMKCSLDMFKSKCVGTHTHSGHTQKTFWDTVEGMILSGDMNKVDAFVNKSNRMLTTGRRFQKIVGNCGTPEMKTKYGVGQNSD